MNSYIWELIGIKKPTDDIWSKELIVRLEELLVKAYYTGYDKGQDDQEIFN
jgi:hypothetical protein